METSGEEAQGIVASSRRFVRVLLAVAQNRLDLLLVEAREERARFFGLLLLAGLVVALGFLTLSVVVFTIVVLCVQAGRIDLLAGLALICLAATVVSFLWLRSRLKAWSPFPSTLEELRKDRSCLAEKN